MGKIKNWTKTRHGTPQKWKNDVNGDVIAVSPDSADFWQVKLENSRRESARYERKDKARKLAVEWMRQNPTRPYGMSFPELHNKLATANRKGMSLDELRTQIEVRRVSDGYDVVVDGKVKETLSSPESANKLARSLANQNELAEVTLK